MEKFPTRIQTIQILEKLISGSIDRDEVSSWAEKYYLDDSFLCTDQSLMNLLENLMSVNLIGSDRPYLYTNEDFEAWLKEIQNN